MIDDDLLPPHPSPLRDDGRLDAVPYLCECEGTSDENFPEAMARVRASAHGRRAAVLSRQQRAPAWKQRTVGAFLEGYRETIGARPYAPPRGIARRFGLRGGAP